MRCAVINKWFINIDKYYKDEMNAVINKWKNKSQNNRYIIIDKFLFSR